MSPKRLLLATCLGAALASFSLSSQACFTIIVGKDASSTGEILVGHNEDNDRRIITSQYWVPAAKHKKGETLYYEPGTAKIPQVAQTLGYWWSQTLAPDGYSFSDGFINEKGVLVVSNNCGDTYEKDEKVKNGGVGYGIRRIVAERAHTAREAVQIAIDLVTRYGYTHQGRTYTFADRNEAWQVALLRGHRYLARRVGDNEMTFLANAYLFDKIDLNDKENVIASPDLVQHAIKMGTYKPAKAGDYSDFNFREAYQPDRRRAADWNMERVATFLEMMTGKESRDYNNFPFVLTPSKKISEADLRKFLRGQSKWEERDHGFHLYSLRDIGNLDTYDSVVFRLNQDPLLTTTWRTNGRPFENAYVPAFPLAAPALAQSFMSPEEGLYAQFRSKPKHLHYSPDRNVYTFIATQSFLDWMPDEREDFQDDIEDYEKAMTKELDKVLVRAKTVAAVDRARAKDVLHTYNVLSYNEILGLNSAWLKKLNQHDMVIMKDSLSQKDTGNVDVVLFGQKGFNVKKIDAQWTSFGSAYSNADDEQNLERAKPSKITFKDLNGDGFEDAVMTFPVKGATAYTFPGVDTELFLFTRVDGEPVAAFDTVMIKK